MKKSLAALWTEKPVTRLEVNTFAKKALTYLKPGITLLDLGSGYGCDSAFFARKGLKVTAVDFSAASIEYMQKNMVPHTKNLAVLLHDLSQTLPFHDRHFDAVYAHLSVHYFDDATTRRIIADIKRVLKPGGLLFIKCKSVDDPHYGKGKKVGEDMYDEEYVRHFFRKEYMAALLEEWEIVSLRRSSSVYVHHRSAFIEAIARKSHRH